MLRFQPPLDDALQHPAVLIRLRRIAHRVSCCTLSTKELMAPSITDPIRLAASRPDGLSCQT
jgi:hypothetical protein